MSTHKTSFVKQAAILAAAGILVRFIGFLYRLPLTDLLGDQGNGIYGKAYTIYTFLLILSSAGLPAAISKMVSERITRGEYSNAHRVFKVSLAVSGLSGFVAAVILWLGAGWLANAVYTPDSKYAILTLAPTVLIVGIMSAFRGYFQGMKNTVPTAISQVVEQVFHAVFSVYLAYILIKQGVEFASAGGTAGTGIGAAMGLVVIAAIYLMLKPDILRNVRKGGVPSESSSKIAFELFATALPIIAGAAIFSVTSIIDMKMVSSCLMRAGVETLEEADALYGQLTGKYVVLTTLPVSLASALATAAVPNIAAARVANNREELHNKINIALKLTMVLSIPAAVGMGVLAESIVVMLFPRHPDGAELLTIGSISIIFLALAQIVTGMLQGINWLKVPVIAAFFGGIIKIPINYWLISDPKIKVVGAVISTIACYMVASSIDLFAMIRATEIEIDWSGIFLKPAMASVVMGVTCFVFYNSILLLVPSNTIACLSAIIIGVAVYFVYMLAFDGITAEDLEHVPAGGKLAGLCQRVGLL